MDADAEFAAAECNLLRLLLLELTDAMIARGAMTRADVAGALLRAEKGAEILDDMDESCSAITRHHASLARAISGQWSERLALEPWLYALRKLGAEWTAAGSPAPSPLYPQEVLAWSRDDDG